MIGGYNYTTGLSPEEAFVILIENRENKFDSNIIHVFLQRTTYYKIGSEIKLPDGTHAKIVGFDNYINSPHRPIVLMKSGRILNLLTSTLQ